MAYHPYVKDVDGKEFNGTESFYYVVNDESKKRVFIIDPHVTLWLVKRNAEWLKEGKTTARIYGIPGKVNETYRMFSNVSEDIKSGVEPRHRWEYLGKHYRLYVDDIYSEDTYPWLGNTSDNLRNFNPNVTVLSNLVLGIKKVKTFDWDLKDRNVLDDVINYTKDHHSGIIATHGTLSDWKVWKSKKKHYKIGSRGHVGDSIGEASPFYEKTVAAMLGMPHLALYELVRDKIAEKLCDKKYTYPAGLAVGSTPLQVPYAPLNTSMMITLEGESSKVLEKMPDKFNVSVPSVYDKFNISAHTNLGWQLAFPRALAYCAFNKLENLNKSDTRSFKNFSYLLENVSGIPHNKSFERLNSSIRSDLAENYNALTSANISEQNITTRIHIPGLNKTKEVTISIDKEKMQNLFGLMPVKVVAVSENCSAAIITHDKYWDQFGGYRAVYLSFEPESASGEDAVPEKILTNSVEWVSNWSYVDILGRLGKVLLPKELADKYNRTLDNISGSMILSKGAILNENGYNKIKLDLSAPTKFHVLIAHPASEGIHVKVLRGNAKLENRTTSNNITRASFDALSAGAITLGLNATNPKISMSPAYVSVKQEIKPPIASFAYSPENPAVNQTITFNASSSYDPDGTVVSYNWSYGDGYFGAGEVTTHSYSLPANYTVTLTITDDDGATNTTSKVVNVRRTSPGDFEAKEVFLPEQAVEGETVNVTAHLNYTGPVDLRLVPVEFFANGTKIGENYTTDSFIGQRNVSIKWDTTGFERNYTVKAILAVNDTNPENNVAKGNISIVPFEGTVKGRVTYPDKYPTENATVMGISCPPPIPVYNLSLSDLVNLTETNPAWIWWTRTNDTGNYQVNVTPGNYYKIAWKGSFKSDWHYIIVNQSETVKNDMVLDRVWEPYGGVVGTVTYSNKPVPNATIIFAEIIDDEPVIPLGNLSVEELEGLNATLISGVYWTTTNEDGHYEKEIPEGEYIKVAFKDRKVSKLHNLSLDSGKVVVNNLILHPVAEKIEFFGTGPGTYPSISGAHNGTITPNQTIIATKLYTYPCEGTGGHSEYVKIWNDTWSTEASWNGYKEDWHNITFPESFTLKSGETYNYTIETGSYPQIIHAKEYNAKGGEITCTEFVDANGKKHDGWIPAIKLY